jgi:hypothetical protein
MSISTKLCDVGDPRTVRWVGEGGEATGASYCQLLTSSVRDYWKKDDLYMLKATSPQFWMAMTVASRI